MLIKNAFNALNVISYEYIRSNISAGWTKDAYLSLYYCDGRRI
jgi:hypothetical protein